MLLVFAQEGKFEYIYEKYKRLLLAKAYDIVKDHGLAEYAVSEAYIRAYKNMHKIDDPDSAPAISFLVTITKNVAIDIYNKQKRNVPTDFAEYEEADDFNLEETIEHKHETAHAMELVGSLREELRAVFLLKYAHDLPHKEIAKMLGITENNVTVRLHRAKAKLQKLAKEVLA